MIHKALTVLLISALLMIAESTVFARGPGGGGGRGGGGGFGGGGGGARSAPVSRSPAMSAPRPSPSAQRPPASAAARPSAGATGARPSTGAPAAARPAAGGAGAARPAAGGVAAARPAAGAAAGARPSASQLNNFLDVPKASTGAVAGGARPAAGSRPAGGAAAEFLQQGGARPSTLPAGGAAAAARTGAAAGAAGVAAGAAAGAAALPGLGRGAAGVGVAAGSAANRAARTDTRAGRVDNRAGRIENRSQWQQNRTARTGEVLDQMTNETPLRDFWSDHPVWGAWAITRPFRWATWGMMDSWLGYGAQPYGYSYGENVYYQDGAVYSGDQQVATAEEYAQQAEDIAASAPETPPDQMQWMPLGVFALTQDGESSGAPPTLFLQLVISKQGVISGTFNNKATGETQTIEGAVDKTTQRAAWGIEGRQRPIIETGLSNLTKDSAPALIHFDGGETQQWLMVRLPDPDQKG